MLGLLSWLPLVGPLMDGVASMFGKFKDTELGKYKIDGEVRTTEVQASTQQLIAFKDDIGIRISRDLVVFPVSVWVALYSWDTIMALRFPEIMWHLADFPKEVAYLPGAVLTFLLGNIAMSKWKR